MNDLSTEQNSDNTVVALSGSHEMDRWISIVLRAGVIISVALILVGTILTFIHRPDFLTTNIASVPREVPDSLVAVFKSVMAGQGTGIVALGLLTLIATPVMRVALTIILFWREKDRTFVWITTTVLLLLIFSLIFGKVE